MQIAALKREKLQMNIDEHHDEHKKNEKNISKNIDVIILWSLLWGEKRGGKVKRWNSPRPCDESLVYSDSEDLCVGVTLPEVVCDLTVQDHHESFIISRIDRKWNSNVRLLRGPWPQCAFRQSKRSKTITQLPKKQFGDWFTLLIVSRVCK